MQPFLILVIKEMSYVPFLLRDIFQHKSFSPEGNQVPIFLYKKQMFNVLNVGRAPSCILIVSNIDILLSSFK